MEDFARRPWWRRRWVAAGAAILVVLGLWWAIDRPGVDVGRHVAGHLTRSDAFFERHFTAEVPSGYLYVTMTAGHVLESASGEESTAPDGTTYVEVDWEPHVLDDAPVWPAPDATRRTEPRAQLTLVSGGRHYTVASKIAATGKPSSAVIVVKGSAADGAVRVRFGHRAVPATLGYTPAQGRGAPVRDGVPCADRGHAYAHVHCTLVAYRSGYVAGLGVAPDGKDWLLVHDSRVTRGRGDVTVYGLEGHATYRPSGKPTVAVTVEDLGAPDRVAGADTVEGADVHLAARAWLVPHGDGATVHLRYRLPTRLDRTHGDMPGAPTTRVVQRTSTVTYRG